MQRWHQSVLGRRTAATSRTPIATSKSKQTPSMDLRSPSGAVMWRYLKEQRRRRPQPPRPQLSRRAAFRQDRSPPRAPRCATTTHSAGFQQAAFSESSIKPQTPANGRRQINLLGALAMRRAKIGTIAAMTLINAQDTLIPDMILPLQLPPPSPPRSPELVRAKLRTVVTGAATSL